MGQLAEINKGKTNKFQSSFYTAPGERVIEPITLMRFEISNIE